MIDVIAIKVELDPIATANPALPVPLAKLVPFSKFPDTHRPEPQINPAPKTEDTPLTFSILN